ncbi:X2-like carbohydrate binding domain-containing protein [Anaerosporobacter faecicola]|uniref:X2-like carbohydrate binding domain-containing protein n=1 Tax=Anaerosporobacter faecicola TaxID=2718714 RepID=UPI00143914E3|nr:X2-like carbohydrate binding domain-containing protein [Anaerosporobacter faecicola]
MRKQVSKRKLFSVILATVFVMGSLHPTPDALASTETIPSESYSWNNVALNGGGFVPGIIFNETEPNLIYARTDIGGAYRWNEATQSWKSLNDSVGWADWNKNGVDALATDPIDTNRVYMATGTYTNSWDTNGQIMRSTDKGDTWETTSLPFKVGGNMPGRSMGERLVIDPNSNNIIYFGARGENGLWKSTDYGVTWNQVESFTTTGTYVQSPGEEYGSEAIGIAWITFDKSSSTLGTATQTIYIGTADTGNCIYRSTDGGTTWEAISGQPVGYLPHHGVLSSNGMLYISYSNGCGPYDGSKGYVYRYNTATGEWLDISPVSSTSDDNYFGYGGLSVDAQNPDTLMVSTLNCWWPDANIYRSTDGGVTWTSAWSWYAYPTRSLRYDLDISNTPWLNFGIDGALNADSPSPKLGWMIGDLEIDPFNSDRMFYGTGATIYGTTELTNWDSDQTLTIEPYASGIEETAVISLVSLPTGTSHLLSGLGDIGGFRHESFTSVPSYGYVSPIFVSTTCIDYAESNSNYVVRVGNVDRSYTTNKACAISNDGGSNWYSVNSEPTGVAGGGQVAVSADGSVILWSPNPDSSGTEISVYRSTTGGNSWTACSGLPAQSSIYSDRVNPNKFYAFKSGVFYISTDGGVSFAATGATGLPEHASSVVHSQAEKATCAFKTVPGIEGDIWFAGGNTEDGTYGLWHSTDSGATFTKLSNVEEADTIGFGKAAEGADYMALYTTAKINGVRGIFRSDDCGESWIRINDDAHQYGKINMCITGDPRIYGRVYLGTNGRGIIYGDTLDTPIPVVSSEITPTEASIDLNSTELSNLTVSMTLNGNALNKITCGNSTLTLGTDYEVNDETVTITTDYLATLSTGTTTLTFDFSSGLSRTFLIVVTDSSQEVEIDSDLDVQMFNGTTSITGNTISIKYKLTNKGTTTLDLTKVSLRYYYTNEDNISQSYWCDWSTVGSSNITGSFVNIHPEKTNANCYFQTGFSTGSLAPGASVELQLRIAKDNWSNYDQSNDYSFNATASSYTSWSYVTAYINNTLSFGVEP